MFILMLISVSLSSKVFNLNLNYCGT